MLRGPYRAGPWPGLTVNGAIVLIACAALLAVGQVLIGPPRGALPDLAVVGVTALLPMCIAMRLIQAPGAASAVCGAYLLPRTLISLLQPSIELPPLLLAPALAFDVVWWFSLPRGQVALAGAAYGLIFSVVQPPYAVLLGGDPALWSGQTLVTAALATIGASTVIAPLSVRGRATRPPAMPRSRPRP